MLRPVRRIVTANDANGKSGVMIDGDAENTITVLTELWITEAGKHHHRDGIDHASRSTQLEPPKGGTLFRYFEILPESEYAHLSEAEKQQAAADSAQASNKALQEQQKTTRCNQARDRYNILKDVNLIYHLDEQGNRVYDTDSQADAKREAARQAMQSACGK